MKHIKTFSNYSQEDILNEGLLDDAKSLFFKYKEAFTQASKYLKNVNLDTLKNAINKIKSQSFIESLADALIIPKNSNHRDIIFEIMDQTYKFAQKTIMLPGSIIIISSFLLPKMWESFEPILNGIDLTSKEIVAKAAVAVLSVVWINFVNNGREIFKNFYSKKYLMKHKLNATYQEYDEMQKIITRTKSPDPLIGSVLLGITKNEGDVNMTEYKSYLDINDYVGNYHELIFDKIIDNLSEKPNWRVIHTKIYFTEKPNGLLDWFKENFDWTAFPKDDFKHWNHVQEVFKVDWTKIELLNKLKTLKFNYPDDSSNYKKVKSIKDLY